MPARARPVLTALIVLTGVFLSSLDLFIVNIAFPSISATYHGESLSSLSWVLSAYTIVFAAALVPAGRWADRAGRKRAFLLGLAIFAAASALCAIAPSLELPHRRPGPPGHRRRPHAAHLSRPAAPRLRPGPQGGGHRAVVGGRRRGRRVRPAHRRAPRAGELALGVPRQPALQRARARARRPSARRGARPRRPQVRPPGRRPADGRRGQPRGGHRRRHGLGLDQRADHRCLRAGRRGRCRAGRAFAPPPQPHHRAGRHPSPRRRTGRSQLIGVLRWLRRDGPRRRPPPDRACGTSRYCAPGS